MEVIPKAALVLESLEKHMNLKKGNNMKLKYALKNMKSTKRTKEYEGNEQVSVQKRSFFHFSYFPPQILITHGYSRCKIIFFFLPNFSCPIDMANATQSTDTCTHRYTRVHT